RNTAFPYEKTAKINIKEVNTELLEDIGNYLLQLTQQLNEKRNKAARENDEKYLELVRTLGGEEEYYANKQRYFNKRLNDLVTNRTGSDMITQVNDKWVQLKDPIYKTPDSNFGRAHFYASYKRLGNTEIPTFWFNLMFIWLTTLLLYFTLKGDVLNRILNKIGK
ncbi:hypothetical protein ACT29I_25755, partial [Saccharicrinis sp. GN24d3]